MLQEFVKIQREAHKIGLPVVCWIYPRGKGVRDKKEKELMAYSTRVGLELGADIIKIHPTGIKEDLDWAIKSAGKAKVVIAGGSKKDEKALLKEVKEAMQVNCTGLAIGRNIWQSKDPIKLTNKIKKIIWP